MERKALILNRVHEFSKAMASSAYDIAEGNPELMKPVMRWGLSGTFMKLHG